MTKGIICSVLLVLAGCGTVSITPDPKYNGQEHILTPDTFVSEVSAIYVQAMQEITQILKAQPEITDDLKKQVASIKEKYISQLLPYGKKKETFSNLEKSQVDNGLALEFMQLPKDAFHDYSSRVNYYVGKDSEFYKLITSFNIITQYADFALLQKQEPEEAERLGIK
jgi:hypothetical protein